MADSVENPSIAEETSPDLLKNTPTNIARLEDVIEHSKGRQKYLAQTRSPSDGGDIRWYFCKVPLAENGEVFNQFSTFLCYILHNDFRLN
uniref:Uncharacterized protein MANES_S009500 n=1 Tax=Rhizophora mucronata TaxID=61149 RepID=A0A2P2MMR9_RHIMU